MTAMQVPSVSAVSDVLALWGDDGWLTPPLQPAVAASSPVVGRAVTVLLEVADAGAGLAPLYDVLSSDLRDCVVVIAGAADAPGAVWGEILTLAAQRQGAVGVLVDGFVRDVPDVAPIGMPLYSRGERVAGPNGRAHVAAVGGEVMIGGVAIAPDDRLVLDDTGCVRVHAAQLADVIDAATRYTEGERQVVEALQSGETLDSAYRFKKSAVDELRR